MLILTIQGIPQMNEELLARFIRDLQFGINSIAELGITPMNVTVFMPSDRVQEGLGDELICTIYSLPDITKNALRFRLMKHVYWLICGFARTNLEECKKVAVVFPPINIRDHMEGDPHTFSDQPSHG